MTTMLEGLDGVQCTADDILVWGEDASQRNQRLRAVLDRCRERNLKLNREKCKTQRTQLTYVGHFLTADGLQPDPEKVRAVQQMPEPVDKSGVMRFMGMVQYLTKFIPNLSETVHPCEALLKVRHSGIGKNPRKRASDSLNLWLLQHQC